MARRDRSLAAVTSLLSHLECARCGTRHDAHEIQHRCACGGTLLARYDLGALEPGCWDHRPLGLWRYRELLPIAGEPLSLGEGITPLVPLERLSERWETEVWLKDDGPLPGGTFKARGASVGLGRAVELGVRAVVMPSAGNAGGAWSLYAARAGVELTAVLAASAPRSNHAEVTVAGGRLDLVDGTLADAGERARELARSRGAYLAATFAEPYRLEGKKTAWLELFEQLGGRWPRTVVLPVGGGVAAVALAKAVAELSALNGGAETPRIVGVQPDDCAPLVRAFEAGAADADMWPGIPRTIASGLRVPAPAEGALVLETVRASSGTMIAVSEEEIVTALRDLATAEGVFACPEGAAAGAGGARLAARGALEGPVVLYNTGAGAKYLDALADVL
jgi:threonine synthase